MKTLINIFTIIIFCIIILVVMWTLNFSAKQEDAVDICMSFGYDSAVTYDFNQFYCEKTSIDNNGIITIVKIPIELVK